MNTNHTEAVLPGELSSEELRILALLAQGFTTDIAARRLDMSDRTLRRRIASICQHLQVATRIEAIAEAARHGLI